MRTVASPNSAASTAGAMPAGPAPMTARSKVVTLYRRDASGFGDGSSFLDAPHHTALPVGHPVDFREAIETDPHHAIRRPRAAFGGVSANTAEAGDKHRRCRRGAGRDQRGAAFDGDRDRGEVPVTPLPEHQIASPKTDSVLD